MFLSWPPSTGGTDALTVYQVDDDMVEPTPEVEEAEYEKLGCAADLTTGDRVRASDREPETDSKLRDKPRCEGREQMA